MPRAAMRRARWSWRLRPATGRPRPRCDSRSCRSRFGQNDLPGARQALRDSLELALAIGRPLSLLAAIAIFTDLLAAQGERRAAARLLRFATSHPAMTEQGRHQLQPRLDALADVDPGDREPPWPGAPLDELARRIVAETPAGHASLAAALRASG